MSIFLSSNWLAATTLTDARLAIGIFSGPEFAIGFKIYLCIAVAYIPRLEVLEVPVYGKQKYFQSPVMK